MNGSALARTLLEGGPRQTCALTTAGGVQCRGDNFYGQFREQLDDSSPVPVAVAGLSSGVSALSAAPYDTCALTTAGGVQCWGSNMFGQLGNNSTTDSLVPVQFVEP